MQETCIAAIKKFPSMLEKLFVHSLFEIRRKRRNVELLLSSENGFEAGTATFCINMWKFVKSVGQWWSFDMPYYNLNFTMQ